MRVRLDREASCSSHPELRNASSIVSRPASGTCGSFVPKIIREFTADFFCARQRPGVCVLTELAVMNARGVIARRGAYMRVGRPRETRGDLRCRNPWRRFFLGQPWDVGRASPDQPGSRRQSAQPEFSRRLVGRASSRRRRMESPFRRVQSADKFPVRRRQIRTRPGVRRRVVWAESAERYRNSSKCPGSALPLSVLRRRSASEGPTSEYSTYSVVMIIVG